MFYCYSFVVAKMVSATLTKDAKWYSVKLEQKLNRLQMPIVIAAPPNLHKAYCGGSYYCSSDCIFMVSSFTTL
jgi:hypothetical protein